MSGSFEETMARARARLRALEAAIDDLARRRTAGSERADGAWRERRLGRLVAEFEAGEDRKRQAT
ncbi:hypothetical protein [Mycolicibacterium goodii]|uniref:hypothetical protein n=1 Tax=Mycolicibacterium goodii TaxID=134601 RepID=UPI001BDC20EE|nr:hypothetical protein [Mycolicibacterium goodii]MBU8828445.1 hypothetical protein [Mycolicibacterium goodii]